MGLSSGKFLRAKQPAAAPSPNLSPTSAGRQRAREPRRLHGGAVAEAGRAQDGRERRHAQTQNFASAHLNWTVAGGLGTEVPRRSQVAGRRRGVLVSGLREMSAHHAQQPGLHPQRSGNALLFAACCWGGSDQLGVTPGHSRSGGSRPCGPCWTDAARTCQGETRRLADPANNAGRGPPSRDHMPFPIQRSWGLFMLAGRLCNTCKQPAGASGPAGLASSAPHCHPLRRFSPACPAQPCCLTHARGWPALPAEASE